MAKKKGKGDWAVPVIIILILFSGFIPAAIVTYLYYRSYKKIPDVPSKGTALFYSVISCIPFYISGIYVLTIFYNKFTKSVYNIGDTWIICSALIIFITLPAWLAYLYQIKKIKGMNMDAASYVEALDLILKNKQLDDKEIGELKTLVEKNKISATTLSRIHKDAFVSALFNCATDDFQINPSEKEFLQKIADNLNLDQDVLDHANKIIGQTEAIKQIIDGHEQGITTTVFMPQKNERCIMLEDCTLYENVKKGFYIGGSVGLKNILPFGELFNPRFYLGRKVNYDQLDKIDNGKIALSTTRIVFIGDNITRAIDFDDIIGLDIGEDCFQINRQGKVKKEVFKMVPDTMKLFIGALFQAKG